MSTTFEPTVVIRDSQIRAQLRYRFWDSAELKPFLQSAHVVAGKGTGLVHTAPTHGHDDFRLGKQHGLSDRLIVDDAGRFCDSGCPDLGNQEN